MPSENASDTPFLDSLLANLAETKVDLCLTQIFEGNIEKPRLKDEVFVLYLAHS